ncbi:nucleotide-diphospho-sugar transferase [Gongronella butleri]|nr:nucleotide-diphospho-sugar transferase [Gongronella butleri]
MHPLLMKPSHKVWLAVGAAMFLLMLSWRTLSSSAFSHPATSPTRSKGVSSAGSDDPVRACFVILVRNNELDGIKSTIAQVEQTFNRKFNYPYVFLNDDYFTDEFIEQTSAMTNAPVSYGKLDSQMWGYPSHINLTYAAEQRTEMAKMEIPYAGSESYRHMCRFQSGYFFRHRLLDGYDYYWRLEPNVYYYCDIDYDIFKYMRDNNKKYGFTISFKEYMATVPTLWNTVMQFKKDYPEVVKNWPAQKDSMWEFITNDNGETYNSCHFWTNFEIAALDLWRSNDYLKYFNYLDRSGGFYYERWGDAPVHSIAAAMMLRKDEFHFFNDIGYSHTGYVHCPTQPAFRDKCSCDPASNFDYDPNLSCYSVYEKALRS